MGKAIEQIAKELARVLRDTDKRTPKAYDTQAVVTRIDEDGTAWVHIAGGVDETPVKRTIACSEGDSVQVRVSGGRAWITGNASAPPTDDATAIYARTIAREARASADNAQMVAESAEGTAAEAIEKAQSAVTKADGSLASDTLHYLATNESSGVTISTAGWTTSVQTISADKPYLWIYHTYTKANGSVVHTQPVIIGTFGRDGTSVTILGSYNTLAELQAAHPTGSLGDAYMVAGDLYVWNGSDWENVGQIQGPQGAQGPQGETGATGPTGPTGPQGVSVTKVEPQYYLSTSASSATGGSWSIAMTYSAGKYIWTREKITLSNGNTTYSTAVYNSALTSACANALSAHQIAEDTNQYFWHTESGTDTGTHVTEKTQDDFLADPTNGGGNVLMRSNGIAIRDGLTELTEIDGDGLSVNDDTGVNVASFIRDKIELKNGSGATIFKANATDSTTTQTCVQILPQETDRNSTIVFNNTPTEGTTISVSVQMLDIDVYPNVWRTLTTTFTAGVYEYKDMDYNVSNTVRVTYSASSMEYSPRTLNSIRNCRVEYTTSAKGPYFALGTRGSNDVPGVFSGTIGEGLNAPEAYTFAVGKYNKFTSGDVFNIGYGTSESSRNTLFRVTQSGVAESSSTIKAPTITATAKVSAPNCINTYNRNDDGWCYRKWSYGTIEAWGVYDSEVSVVPERWGSGSSIYYWDDYAQFPTGLFSSAPTQVYITTGNSQWWPMGTWDYSANGFSFRVARPASSMQRLVVRIYAIKF